MEMNGPFLISSEGMAIRMKFFRANQRYTCNTANNKKVIHNFCIVKPLLNISCDVLGNKMKKLVSVKIKPLQIYAPPFSAVKRTDRHG